MSPTKVPLLPVRSAVLFPGECPTYDIGRTRSLALVERLRPGDLLVAFTQKEPRTIEVALEDLHAVGTLARVKSVHRRGARSYGLTLEGVGRARLERIAKSEPYLEAEVATLDEAGDGTDESRALARELASVVEQIRKLADIDVDAADPGRYADQIAAALDLPWNEKVDVLAEPDVPTRLRLLAERIGHAYAPDAAAARKERVLHTRVPAALERELKRVADQLRVSISNLVRTVLEDALARRSPGPLGEVFAYQPITLAQPARCTSCDRQLQRGVQAHLGLTDQPAGSRILLCAECLPSNP